MSLNMCECNFGVPDCVGVSTSGWLKKLIKNASRETSSSQQHVLFNAQITKKGTKSTDRFQTEMKPHKYTI